MSGARAEHGTPAAYKRHGYCPCQPCRDANAAYYFAARARRSENVPARVHGTTNGYVNYDCRCDACRSAGRVVNRQNYVRRTARIN